MKFDRENVRAMCVQMLPALMRDSGGWPICDYVLATRLSFAVRDRLRPDLRLAGWKRHFAERVRPIANETIADFHEYEHRLNIAAHACIDVLEEIGVMPTPQRIAAWLFRFFYPHLADLAAPIPVGFREEKMRMIAWHIIRHKIGTAAA